MEETFLTQLVNKPTREGIPSDLFFVSREALAVDVMVGGCPGHSSHKMIEVLILEEVRKGSSRTASLDFQRADFGLFRSLIDSILCEAVLKSK